MRPRASESSTPTTPSIRWSWRARTRRSWSSATRTGRFRSRSCARVAGGSSTPRLAVMKFSIDASAAMSSARSRLASPMSTRSRNTAEKGVAGNGVYAQRIVSTAGQEGRPLLAGAIRRGRKSAGRACRRGGGGGLSRRPAAHPVSRLLLQDPHPAGTECTRRRPGLRRARQDDRRLRAGRLSGGVPEFRA